MAKASDQPKETTKQQQSELDALKQQLLDEQRTSGELKETVGSLKQQLDDLADMIQNKRAPINSTDENSAVEPILRALERMQSASSGNRTGYTQPSPSGQKVKVEEGDTVAYLLDEGGGENCPGGWFKVSDEYEPHPDKCHTVGVCLEGFSYDRARGARTGEVKYIPWKEWANGSVRILHQLKPTPELASPLMQGLDETFAGATVGAA